MKSITIIHIFLFFFTANLFAQVKQVDYLMPNWYNASRYALSQDNGFFLISKHIAMSNNISMSILKFDNSLKPVWKKPIIIEGYSTNPYESVQAYMLSYTNPTTKATTDYIVAEDILQVLPDGNVIKNTQIRKKELNEKAAVFTNAEGLHVLTIVGDETFPTGVLNWYTFSHEKMTQTKRTINLPLPSKVDKDKESGWRLNEVTASGLYFYYVSYKNEDNDKSTPIISNNVIHVDLTGKAGNILNMNPGIEKHNILCTEFQQDIYPNLTAIEPQIYKRGFNSVTTTRSNYYAYPANYTGVRQDKKEVNITPYAVPNDNAYMGIKINENAKRIYTVTALSGANKAQKTSKITLKNTDPPLESLVFSIYDLEGKQIAQSNLKVAFPELLDRDDNTRHAHHIYIQPLPNDEGVICQLTSNGNGLFWVFDNQGQLIQEEKVKLPYLRNESNHRSVYAHFPTTYTSLKDFKVSPYLLKEKSPPYQFLQEMEEKDKKKKIDYLSLKDKEVIAIWDDRRRKITFHSFSKN
jgi:hypothetical protein